LLSTATEPGSGDSFTSYHDVACSQPAYLNAI